MALRVKYLGQNGPHAAAKNAGFQQGDVLIAFDGKTDLMRETDVFAHALLTRKPAETLKVSVVRGGKTLELNLPMQE
ncbi:MAG TPA: PDZ domain-containing protein, partial [Gemmataceae bacterium]|nr:PDZ domain-containing protein [Gemmataceae bacterium]